MPMCLQLNKMEIEIGLHTNKHTINELSYGGSTVSSCTPCSQSGGQISSINAPQVQLRRFLNCVSTMPMRSSFAQVTLWTAFATRVSLMLDGAPGSFLTRGLLSSGFSPIDPAPILRHFR